MALSLRSIVPFAAIALLASACTIRFGPVDDDSDFTWDDSSAQVTDSSSSSANGGAGGGGEGGAGGNTSSSTSSSSDGGSSGGGGGDPYCNDEFGSGQTAAICDGLAVAPSTSGMCDYHAPLGYLACQRGFEVFAAGQAEDLAACIGNIQPYDACDESPVTKCVAKMYDNACTNSYVANTCASWGAVCSDNGDNSFDVNMCETDLNPFSDAGLNELTECMNSKTGNCQDRYDYCIDQVVTLG